MFMSDMLQTAGHLTTLLGGTNYYKSIQNHKYLRSEARHGQTIIIVLEVKTNKRITILYIIFNEQQYTKIKRVPI